MASFPTSVATAAPDAGALTEPQRALLARLQAYAPDAPDAPLPYSRRLAEAERWPYAHALAVIDEYKRFAFLAQAAGHPVTPSHAVDAAWHLHLQYTREYWDVFCADVLRAPLHHVPGAGAPDEAAKYEQQYRQTLDSYLRLFGCEPPAAIWPRPAAEPAGAPAQCAEPHAGPSSERAAPSRATRTRGWRRIAKFAWPAAAISVAATCASASDFNVMEFAGPEFLAFYLPLCIAALLLIAGLQWIEYRYRAWGTCARESSPELSAEEAAYLAGGGSRVAQVTTLSLAHAGAIELARQANGTRVRIADPQHAGAYGADWEWLRKQLGGETSYHAFRERLAWHDAGHAEALHRKGWLWAPGDMRTARMAARTILLLVLGTGAAKLAIGLSRGRPVLLLMIFMAAFMAAYHFLAGRLPGFGLGGVTSGGQAALDAHRSERQGDRATPDGLLWTAALFGAGALAGTVWAEHLDALMAPPPVVAAKTGGSSGSSDSDAGGSSSSDCGSSSLCSSSSSCSSSSCGGCSSS
ncbi:TIGR04222 domain-containing membrane protein [Burkholderia sp. Bp9002]|nr:TIGR04222 domain-containing membrane protein [Burkholderia sp. Bp9002]